MTTVQESPNGHSSFPPPCSFPDSQDQNRSKDSNNNSNSTPVSPTPARQAFPASAYHVPPPRFAPKAHAYRQDDFLDLPPDTDPLPDPFPLPFSHPRPSPMAPPPIH